MAAVAVAWCEASQAATSCCASMLPVRICLRQKMRTQLLPPAPPTSSALPVLVLALAEATGSRLAVPWSDSYELAGASWAALILRMFRAALRIHRLPPGDFGRAGVLHTTPPPDNSLFPTVVGKLGATLYTNRTLEGPPPGWLEGACRWTAVERCRAHR